MLVGSSRDAVSSNYPHNWPLKVTWKYRHIVPEMILLIAISNHIQFYAYHSTSRLYHHNIKIISHHIALFLMIPCKDNHVFFPSYAIRWCIPIPWNRGDIYIYIDTTNIYHEEFYNIFLVPPPHVTVGGGRIIASSGGSRASRKARGGSRGCEIPLLVDDSYSGLYWLPIIFLLGTIIQWRDPHKPGCIVLVNPVRYPKMVGLPGKIPLK